MAHEIKSGRHGSGEAVRVWMLGGFRVSVGARVVGEWSGKKSEGLVKILALAERHRLHREEATMLLWPHLDQKRAANSFHRSLHFARRNLGSGYLPLRDGLLSLHPGGSLWVDVEAFESAAATARNTSETGAYRAAIELYGGDLLPEDLYEPWAEERRGELRESHLALFMELAALHERRGEHHPAIGVLRRVVSVEPHREEAHLALMRCFALSGEVALALAQYERLKANLAKLGAEPNIASRTLRADISAGKFPPTHPEVPRKVRVAHRLHNLPNSRTSFVGRGTEMAEVRKSLAMTQLLTLTGAGGCGKTRLALEAVRGLVGAYPDGVWMARLAPVSDGSLVARTVAGVLGLREQPGRPLAASISDYLASRQTLLILDNCEHVIDDAAILADTLLDSCEKLRILATSRESLGISGESVRRVSTLSLPGEGDSLDDLVRYESVRLFVDRARAKLPTFGLSEHNARPVAEICRRLDGMPLAIELATARMAALAVGQVAERLNDSLDILALGGRTAESRHRTMRATLEWSHDLLEDAEKILFRRLSVFAGGWSLEAAESVGGRNALDPLDKLVEKSLVVAEAAPNASMRYRMLEPVRQFASEKLTESGESEGIRAKHAAFFLDLAEGSEPHLSGKHPSSYLEMFDTELGNVRAALSWSLEDGSGERASSGLRIAAALGRFWEAYGPGEGRSWLEKALAKSPDAPEDIRAKALNEAGFVAVFEGDAGATDLLEESLAIYRRLGDEAGAAYAIHNIGHAMVHVCPGEKMAELRREVEAGISMSSDKRAKAHLLAFLGFVAGSEYDFVEMEEYLGEAAVLFREIEDIRNAAVCIISMGYISIGRNDPGGAPRFEEGLWYQRELKSQVGIFMAVSGMAGVAALLGQARRAAKMMGFSESLRERIGLTFESMSKARYDYEKYTATIRALLDDESIEAAWNEGRDMTSEEAVEYALGDEDKSPHPEEPKTTAPLTRREREIAGLVARGDSNREISVRLRISERTVEGHVSKILHKLGLRSRTQIAAWMVERDPEWTNV